MNDPSRTSCEKELEAFRALLETMLDEKERTIRTLMRTIASQSVSLDEIRTLASTMAAENSTMKQMMDADDDSPARSSGFTPFELVRAAIVAFNLSHLEGVTMTLFVKNLYGISREEAERIVDAAIAEDVADHLDERHGCSDPMHDPVS